MDCPTCEAMVDAYLDGELSASADGRTARAKCKGRRSPPGPGAARASATHSR